jgi:hypothetical protein
MVQVPDLKFRCYPFNPANDQAFEARVSVELAKVVPVSGRMAHEDHEIQVLDLLVRREIQKHDDLLKRQFAQNQTFTSGTDPNVRSGTEDRFYHQQLLSYIDHQRSALYTDISRELSGQWAASWLVTTNTGTASEALRNLQLVIDQMYLCYSTNAASPSAKRPLFNLEQYYCSTLRPALEIAAANLIALLPRRRGDSAILYAFRALPFTGLPLLPVA